MMLILDQKMEKNILCQFKNFYQRLAMVENYRTEEKMGKEEEKRRDDVMILILSERKKIN